MQDSKVTQVAVQVDGVVTQVGGVATQVDGVATQVSGVATQVGGVATQVGELAVQVGGLTDIQSTRLIHFPSYTRNLTPYSPLVFAEDSGILDRLKPAPRREGAAPCLRGTRMDVLQKIHHWVADNQAPNILWLKGNPGAGKTAVASSLVSELGTNLGSRFYFKRDDAAVNNPIVLWRTVAYDLAITDHSFKKTL